MTTRDCVICGTPFLAKRSDAKTCSPKCRKSLARSAAGKDEILEVLTPAGPTSGVLTEAQLDEFVGLAELVDDGTIIMNLNKKTIPSTYTGLNQEAKVSAAQALARKLGFELIRGSDLPKTEFIPTGHIELDLIIKGFPRRRITEVYGPASVGKTTLMLQTIAQMDPALKVLYVDMENAITPEWMESMQPGLSSRMDLANPLFLEDAATYILERMEHYDLIVFDSVASALIKPEEASDVGNAVVGVKPRIMTSFMRRLVGPLARTRCAVVFINQEKPSIGDMYAPKWYTPGGIALDYAASLRLRLTSNKADRIVRQGEKVGKKVKAEITKNKVGTPDREAQFLITY